MILFGIFFIDHQPLVSLVAINTMITLNGFSGDPRSQNLCFFSFPAPQDLAFHSR